MEFCNKEYVYELENGEIIRVIPALHKLPHLLALHKYESFDFEQAAEYQEHGKKIKHFTKCHLHDMIYNVRVFEFNYDPEISDNEKAKWSLLREFREIGRFLQLILFKRGNQN